MNGPPTGSQGMLRLDGVEPEWHPLVDHCADAAACTEALLLDTRLGRRLATPVGVVTRNSVQVARLGVFTALHDVGKRNVGIQRR